MVQKQEPGLILFCNYY